ncbi:MAG: HNH endonuclease [Lachnospiraceae bacterium]
MGYKYTEITRERIVDTGQKQRHGGESELTQKEWDFVISYFGGKCCYCNKYMDDEPTKDHIKPFVKDGRMTRDNIIPCCWSCNSVKKDNEMVSWYQKHLVSCRYSRTCFLESSFVAAKSLFSGERKLNTELSNQT